RVAGGVVDLLVQRLPVPSGRRPLPRRRPEGHADRPHAPRFGARRAPGVGGDRRELSRARRWCRGTRGIAPVHARCRANRPSMTDIASRRKDYESAGLDVADVDADPMTQWQQWYDQASQAGCVEPNAFVLSTVDGEGWPQSRYLLARGADSRGFSFFTNYESAKSAPLVAEARGAVIFTS